MLISLAEYAKRQGVDPATVRQKVLRGNLEAMKIGRNWCIEESTPYTDGRITKGLYVGARKKKQD